VAAVSLDHQITKKAADGTLTTGELRQFINEVGRACDGNYPEGLKVKARAAFSGGLKSISVTIPGEAKRDD